MGDTTEIAGRHHGNAIERADVWQTINGSIPCMPPERLALANSLWDRDVVGVFISPVIYMYILYTHI